MFKKAYFKIGLVVLLLAALLSVFGVMLAQAADTDYHTLKVTFPVECEKVELKINEGAATELVSGETVNIPKSAAITLTITPKEGYKVSGMYSEDRSVEYTLSNNSYKPSAFTADASWVIECTSRIFSLSYVITDEGNYEISATKPTTHIYNHETEIPIPELPGYKFKSWLLLKSENDTTGTELLPFENEQGQTVTEIAKSYYNNVDTLYLKPVWIPNTYPVYRYDYVFNPNVPNHIGDPLGFVTWNANMGSTVTGAEGEDTQHPGYYFDATNSAYFTSKTVTVDEDSKGYNDVYRFYLPNEYALIFESGVAGEAINFGTATKPEKLIFNQDLMIPNPIRDGYNFVGWTVTLTRDGKTVTEKINATANSDSCTISAKTPAFAADKDTSITLTAEWSAKIYNVTVDYNTPGVENGQALYPFDKGVKIPNPTRRGYTFEGWLVNGELVAAGEELVLEPFAYTDDITLVAQWRANQYTVTLDGNGADSDQLGTTSVTVTFDAAFALPGSFVFPKRTGYTFAGFSLDPEGNVMYTDATGAPLTAYPIWDIDGNTTLYAQWTINQYQVTVNVVNATVTVNGTPYDAATPMFFDFGTTVRIVVTANNGYKVVKWEGVGVTHTAIYEYQFVLGAQDTTLTGTVLEIISAPTFKIDYIKEIVTTEAGTLPDGHYLITCGGETLDVYVSGGKVTINQGPQDTEIDLPESFHGKTISIVTYGVDGVSANSDAQSIAVAARPAKPEMNNGKEIDSVYQDEDTSIVIQMTRPEDIGLYEFACSENADGTGLIWKSASELTSPKAGAVMFEDLKPGAKYYIYIRVKAVAGQHAHGIENCIEQVTKSDATLDAIKRELLALIGDGDGEMVQKLIDAAIAEANGLERPSPTFSQKLEGIYNRISIEIKFAREQDDKIAALKQLHKTLVESGEFNTSGINTLNTIYGVGVEAIKNATATDDVQKAYNKSVRDMGAVLITHLVYGDLELNSETGLPQGTKLFGSRLENIDNLISSVDAAIAAGNISVGGVKMTLAEATEALRTLDVMAAYQMKLTSGNVAFTAFDGGYEIRLLLPSELRGVSGLQVAYYNEKTGELEVLDTERDGNCLVFKASRIADFVILGDPTMNLNGFIGALLVILICQLIAIILLLARRARSAKQARRYSLMLPALLTIRFLPDNGLTIVAVLGGMVILFQIILIYLLLSSDVVYRRKRRSPEPQGYEEQRETETLPVMAEAQDEEAYATEEYVEEEYEAEEFAAAEENSEGDAFAVFSDDPESENGGEYADEQAEEDAFDDFIEPAANPRYSLPDEDEMFVDTETGEIYSAADIAEAEAEGVQFTYDDEYENIPDEESVEVMLTEDSGEETVEWQYDDGEADLPEASAEETAEDASEEGLTEDSAEEDVENAFYEEPDARGDEAPAPDDFYYDPEEENKQYNGYEE